MKLYPIQCSVLKCTIISCSSRQIIHLLSQPTCSFQGAQDKVLKMTQTTSFNTFFLILNKCRAFQHKLWLLKGATKVLFSRATKNSEVISDTANETEELGFWKIISIKLHVSCRKTMDSGLLTNSGKGQELKSPSSSSEVHSPAQLPTSSSLIVAEGQRTMCQKCRYHQEII